MKALGLVFVSVVLCFAGAVTCTIELAPGDLVLSESDGYAVVSFGSDQTGIARSWTTEPGTPLLPVLAGNVLIPAGAEVERVDVVELERQELDGEFRLHPVQPPRPLSRFDEVDFVEPNQAIYGSDVAFPVVRLSPVPAGSKAGYRIAGFQYCPFDYRPASGRLSLITSARIEVRYRESAAPAAFLTQGQRELLDRDVATLVVNPTDVDRMAPRVIATDHEETDVVILTSSTLAPSLAGFRSWLMRKGYFTEIVRIDTISQSGRDTPEKMRNFLKEKFAATGLKYVILAGDVQHVPCRKAYFDYRSGSYVPADWYFADLDGDWDANGNNRFGEMDGDSVDLFADIYVGRLPLDGAGDAANFLKKDTTYEICPDTGYLDNVILPSEWLWPDIDFSGRIVNTNIARALSAASTWGIDSGLGMSPSEVISGLNAGRQLFHFAGHGAVDDFGSTFGSDDIPSLTNTDKLCIVNTMCCDAGHFDGVDCLGEKLVNATNGGAVSTCLNARFGWGAPPCMGPSSNLSMEFYNNFLKGMTQGRAYGLAKDFYRNVAFSQMTYRWSVYDWTLQGDPTMAMWRQVPVVPVVTCDDTIAAMPQTVAFDVENTDGPIPNARCAITHGGELVGRAVTNSTGCAFVPLETVGDTWTLTVTVTAQDAYIHEAPLHVIPGGPAPLVVLDYHRVDDVNGRLDPGDEVDLYLVVRNRGNAAADSVRGRIAVLSPYVTILDTWSLYGDIAVGDTAAGDAYRVRIDPDCPHGHTVEFMLALTSATDGAWVCEPELVVGLPRARGGQWAVHDTGDYVLAVCANGGVGTTQWRGEGLGLVYPKDREWSSSAMMHGSFMLGTDTNWVCDNYYGAPSWKVCPMDFAMEESLRTVWPPELGDKEFLCTFSDANHPGPKDITIDHRSYGSAQPPHEDFVVLEYRIHNNGALPLTGLYTAVACDFRTATWNQNDQYDYAGTDSTRNLAYIKSAVSSETLALGIRHIHPLGMNGYANCIQHSTHINDGFTKAEKMKFMDGRLRQTSGTSRTNWHAISSSGPYAIPAGDSQIVAYVLVGGRTISEMTVHSDTAADWYSPPQGISGRATYERLVRAIQVSPRLCRDRVTVRYSLARLEPFAVRVYDTAGREMERFTHSPAALAGSFVWKPEVAPGVFFIRVGGEHEKLIRVR